MSKLNERQWALYGFIEAMGDQWTCQKDIASALMWYYPLFDETNFHDSQARQTMTVDIRAINDSDEIQKVIISSPRGIKLATEAEWKEYIKREYISAFKKLKRIRKKEKKGKLNGQAYTVYETEQDVINAFIQAN